jgi:hypothetical protein
MSQTLFRHDFLALFLYISSSTTFLCVMLRSGGGADDGYWLREGSS